MTVDSQAFRGVLLEICAEYQGQGPGYFQSRPVLNEALKRLELRGDEQEQALLTAWYDLFRVGVLAWGHNLSNADPPFIHLTEAGRRSLENLSRDPYNPDGYMAVVRPHLSIGSVAESYIEEAVGTFAGGYMKATAVMIGAASESLILNLRDTLVQKLDALGESVPGGLKDWRVKTIRDALSDFLGSRKKQMDRKLSERFSAYWVAMTDQVRLARNDAGHPASVDPVTQETVHASLLLFPELAALTKDLTTWVNEELK